MRRKTDSAITNKGTVAAKESELKLFDSLETNSDVINLLPIRSGPNSQGLPQGNWSKRKLKCRHAKSNGKDDRCQLHSSKS